MYICTHSDKGCLHAIVYILLQGQVKIPFMFASHLDKWKESAKTSLNGPLAWLGNKLS